MPMPNPNIFRYDGPIDHYVMRPLGVQRCPPPPPGPPARPQVDVDDFLHLHEPAFDKFVTWQQESIKCTQAAMKTARRARDAAEFKQWVAIGAFVPAVGFLASSYAMMFTFPFIVPGALLFAVTSVAIALLVGYEERARGAYNEAHAEWQRGGWVLKSQQAALGVAQKTFVRLQAQFGGQLDRPQAPIPAPQPPVLQRTSPPVLSPAVASPVATSPVQSVAGSLASEQTGAAASEQSGAAASVPAPQHAAFWQNLVPPLELFGYKQWEEASSYAGSIHTTASSASAAGTEDIEPAFLPSSTHVAMDIPAGNEGWGEAI
jgi:hypothetical protein